MFVLFAALICMTLGKIKKGKVIPVHALKACRRSRGIAPPILNLGTRWRGGDLGYMKAMFKWTCSSAELLFRICVSRRLPLMMMMTTKTTTTWRIQRNISATAWD